MKQRSQRPAARRWRWAALGLAVLLVASAGPIVLNEGLGARLLSAALPSVARPYLDAPSGQLAEGTQIATAFYAFDVSVIDGCGGRRGGAVMADGATVLCFTTDGALFDLPTLRAVPADLPPRFPAEGTALRKLGLRHAALRHTDAETAHIAMSYLSLDPDRRCVQPMIAEARWTKGTDNITPWRESAPLQACLPWDPDTGIEDSSGALDFGPDGALWVVYGAFGAETPGQPTNSAILRRNAGATTWTELGTGLRNPMGIAATGDGSAWIIDNGPRGGDEVNLVRGPTDFGWPDASLGTDYGAQTRAGEPQVGRHRGGQEPVFAWVPAIAPSDIALSTSPDLPHWRGDLIISALRGGGLYRLRLAEDRVLYAEEIAFGERLRDVALSATGEIFVLRDEGRGVYWLRPLHPNQDPTLGALSLCAQCHAAATGVAAAPTLDGVWGREIASLDNYAYSPALKRVSGRWTEDALRAYLRDPQAFAPETKKTPLNMAPYRLDQTIAALRP